MDRKKLTEAILNHYRDYASDRDANFREALKRIGDMDLVVLAMKMGIDTDKISEVKS